MYERAVDGGGVLGVQRTEVAGSRRRAEAAAAEEGGRRVGARGREEGGGRTVFFLVSVLSLGEPPP